MKTTIIFNKVWQLLLTVVIAASAYSCKKNDPNEGLEAPRLFKPSGVTVRTEPTSAKITWNAPLLSSNLKVAYLAEFSQDTTFATSEFSLQTDTTGVTVGEDKLKVRKKYFVRVKALPTNGQAESNWMISRSFSLTGEQWFTEIRERAGELKETQVALRWKHSTVLNKITLTKAGGQPVEYAITTAETAADMKVITGLEAGTEYVAEIFEGTKSKGFLEFKTPAVTVYATILNPGDDIVAAITNAANGTVIGLNPGTYNPNGSNYNINQKAITLKSTSGDPKDTKLIFKEFVLNGTGAGIKLDGLELDGLPAASLYFLNLVSGNNNADAANFESITINNCTVHGATTSFLRGNRGASAGSYKIDQINITNSLVYDIGSTLGYHFLVLDKVQFNSVNIRRSTLNNVGRALIGCSTTMPAGVSMQINIDYSTINNLGAGNHYALVDANANTVRFNLTNSIITNVPRLTGGNVNAAAARINGAGSGIVFNYNNTFNFTNAPGGTTELTFPTNITVRVGNQNVNPGYTHASTDFTLSANSPLRTASGTGGPIGDPIWSY